ncbi:cytochrome c biogenesis CcdA family protein [Mumia zhuanghuii]|uniref:Cytochrome c biogenesis protein CcdA n=1 Tax=Mumia zhuanghuii TaxID=2585211 RepID=A0A5C4ME84_9ACTN|nr:cytochrome c biogenesis protein CcdA [Mumia zhuanghuii]TNC41000.1 cytochrome c biogenesis protein CcdA [Mumia zhuanghuii]TNC49256.1 cytochrome c biogenesis protein CcdA [Mumia zhuanghuii]
MGDWAYDTVLSGSLLLATGVALLAGLVSFFSPCVVPLLPGYLSYVSGMTAAEVAADGKSARQRGRLVLGAGLFVLGFSAVFVSYGVLFGSVGMQLREYERPISIVMGIVVILLGLAFMGFVPWMQRDVRVHAVPSVGLAVAPLLGVLFAIGWTPCIGPALGAVLGLAYNEGTAGRGAFLTAVYCLGLGVPFLAAAFAFSRFARATAWVRRRQRAISLVGGGLLVVVGVLLLTGLWGQLMTELTSWVGSFEPVV